MTHKEIYCRNTSVVTLITRQNPLMHKEIYCRNSSAVTLLARQNPVTPKKIYCRNSSVASLLTRQSHVIHTELECQWTKSVLFLYTCVNVLWYTLRLAVSDPNVVTTHTLKPCDIQGNWPPVIQVGVIIPVTHENLVMHLEIGCQCSKSVLWLYSHVKCLMMRVMHVGTGCQWSHRCYSTYTSKFCDTHRD